MANHPKRKEISLENGVMQAGEVDGEGIILSQRVKMTDLMRKIKANVRMDANNRWWVSDLLAADCKKNMTSSRMVG